MKSLLLVAAAATLAASASAQNALGFSHGYSTSYTARLGAGGMNPGVVLNHYDTRDYLDWMLDPADPTGGTYLATGCRLVVQDQVGATADSFRVVAYNEGSTPGFPDQAAFWIRTAPINLPASTATGPVAWIYTVGFGATAVAKGPKWFGAELNLANGTWPADGISTWIVGSYGPPATVADFPSTAITQMPQTNITCAMPVDATTGIPTAAAAYTGGTRNQIWFEIRANVASGVPVTITNQTTFPVSNPGGANNLIPAGTVPLGGSTTALSGLYPDVNNTTNNNRFDDIGFLVNDSTVPNGLVFVLVAFGGNPLGSVPLTFLMGSQANPATKGNVCIDFTTAAVFLGVANAAGNYQHMLNLSTPTRNALTSLSPLGLWYQGFVVNTNTTPGLEVHATGCGIQHF